MALIYAVMTDIRAHRNQHGSGWLPWFFCEAQMERSASMLISKKKQRELDSCSRKNQCNFHVPAPLPIVLKCKESHLLKMSSVSGEVC